MTLLEAERPQVRVPRALDGRAAEPPRRLGPRRGAKNETVRRRGREGARAAAGRGGVVPAARPRGRRGRALGRPVGRRRRGRARLQGGSPASSRSRRRLPRDPEDRTDAAGLPAPARRREEAPARLAPRQSVTGRLRVPEPHAAELERRGGDARSRAARGSAATRSSIPARSWRPTRSSSELDLDRLDRVTADPVAADLRMRLEATRRAAGRRTTVRRAHAVEPAVLEHVHA